MEPIRAEVKLRNNRMIRLREELGLSAPDVARAMGVGYSSYVALENMRSKPVTSKGDWSGPARAISEFHGVGLDYLWPNIVLEVADPTRSLLIDEDGRTVPLSLPTKTPEQLANNSEVLGLLDDDLCRLSPRQRWVIRERFGLESGKEKSLQEVGDVFGVNRERIRQIEAKAMRRLRHASSRVVSASEELNRE